MVDALREALTLHELQRGEAIRADLADVEDLDEQRIGDRRCRAHVGEEPRALLGGVGARRRTAQHLQRDPASRALLVGQIDGAAVAAPEHQLDELRELAGSRELLQLTSHIRQIGGQRCMGRKGTGHRAG